jgi:hypothetical protein
MVLYLVGIPVVSVSVAGVILGISKGTPVYEAFVVLKLIVPLWVLHLPLLPLALVLITLAWARHQVLLRLLQIPDGTPEHV